MNVNPASDLHTPRRVIAVVTDAFAPFHHDVLAALRPHFDAAGFGTLGVAGRDVRTDRLLNAANEPAGHYRGAFGTQLDVQGAVIVCGATNPSLSDEALRSYLQELTDGPVVSLGIALPNVPSVEIDWETGIAALMDHVLALPRIERLAFVTGFQGDPHSQMREAGFRAAIAASGRTIDERLIVRGNFSQADSRNAVAGLLARGVSFDGLIAANDDMAIGAMAAITANGLSVPDDVIVAGFDAALCSVTSDPPLTTVFLDTLNLTAATARLVLEAIESGQPLAEDTVVCIDSKLVVRASTGRDHGTSDNPASMIERLLARWETEWAPAGLDVVGLAEAAVSTLQKPDPLLCRRFEEQCVRAAQSTNRVDVIWLRHAWRALHAVIAEARGFGDPAGHHALLSQLGAIDRFLHQIETRHETESAIHRELQGRLVMRLASCSDTEGLWETLGSGLRSIGMLNAWVVAHERGSLDAVAPQDGSVRLLFNLETSDLSADAPFEASRILPSRMAALLESDLHVLVPLRAGDSDIGYMVVEPRGEYLLELEAIASGVAQVLRHVRQVADLEGQAARLQEANDELDRLAGHDALTGLPNRKLFLERLDQHVADASPGEHLSTIFLDLDGFKQINDTLGHAAGDQLLRVIAERLSGIIRESDTLARLGGDEFTIIVRDATDPKRVLDVAQRALESAARPSLIAGQDVSVSASLGIASFPSDGETADELIRNADTAMYAAKGAGKNCFEIYCEPISGADSSGADAMRVTPT